MKTQKLKVESESQQKKKIQPSESEKGKENKKSDIPQRTSPEAAESTDSATNLTNTQSQGDTIEGGSPRRRRPEAGATSSMSHHLSVHRQYRTQLTEGRGRGLLYLYHCY